MYHIIVNPASRSGKGQRIWGDIIKPVLKEKAVAYSVYFSEKAGDVKKLASYITTKFIKENPIEALCNLIVLGGDGTVNEIIQGVADFKRVIIGYIPTGSSNDLARDMGISKDPVEALEYILSAKDNPDAIKLMDRGIAKTDQTTVSFAVSCGIGFDAAVCEEIGRSKFKEFMNRIKLGKLTYLGIAVKHLLTAPRVDGQLYLDDATEPIPLKKLLFLASMNHRYEGGGFKFCPDAIYDDGKLDLCVANRLPGFLILLCIPSAFAGKHFAFPGLDPYRASKVVIKTDKPLWLHTDGEVHHETNTLELSCIKQDIMFIA